MAKMAKFRVKCSDNGKRRIVAGVFSKKRLAQSVAKTINRRKDKSNARVSKIKPIKKVVTRLPGKQTFTRFKVGTKKFNTKTEAMGAIREGRV